MKSLSILSAFTGVITLGLAGPAPPTVEGASVAEKPGPGIFNTLFCTDYNYGGLCLTITSLDGDCGLFSLLSYTLYFS
jgi:hypothetical protein